MMLLKFKLIGYEELLLVILMASGACKSDNTTRSFPGGSNSLQFLISKRGCETNSISSATHVCEMLFFLELKSRPDALCSKVYIKLEECVRSKIDECFGRARSQRSDEYAMRRRYLLQTQYCNDGSLSVKTPRPINYCQVLDYHNEVEQCYKAYHRTFRRNTSDDSLCDKYEKAKMCAMEAEERHCQNGNEILRKLRQYSNADRCWNPFCGNPIVEFRRKIIDRGFKFSFLSKEIQRHMRILARKYKVEGFDQKLIGKGVSSKSCSFNSAVVISNAILNFINQSSSDDRPKHSGMKIGEPSTTTRKKTKRTSPADSGFSAEVSHPIFAASILITFCYVNTRMGLP